jgi:hypothetical protein
MVLIIEVDREALPRIMVVGVEILLNLKEEEGEGQGSRLWLREWNSNSFTRNISCNNNSSKLLHLTICHQTLKKRS